MSILKCDFRKLKGREGTTPRGHETHGPWRRAYNLEVPSILKVARGEESEARELAFELDYQARLTTAQRFEMMFERSRRMAEELLRRGYRKPAEVSKRP